MRKGLVSLRFGRFGQLARAQSGQAVLEYVLMLAVTIAIITIIAVGFRKSIFSLWRGLARDITAACPGCPKNDTAKF